MGASYTLRLLGTLAIERPDGSPVTGRAAQRHRLALLALLALAPRRCMSRDRLVAYVWPESDTERARHLLSVATYELRKKLGEETLVTRGDEVELSAALIDTDVDAFEAAVQSGDWDGAVSIYAGPFLDGFHISDAPDFERWVDAEGARLSRLFMGALEAVARDHTARGESAQSVHVWRRRVTLDPYNAQAARELMLALEVAGDRAAAIRHAQVHATLLREDLGAEPDPDVQALAERLRTEPTPGATVPGAAEPEVPDPGATFAGTAEPEVPDPGATVAGTAEPEVPDPGATFAGTAEPDLAHPGATVLDPSESEVLATGVRVSNPEPVGTPLPTPTGPRAASPAAAHDSARRSAASAAPSSARPSQRRFPPWVRVGGPAAVLLAAAALTAIALGAQGEAYAVGCDSGAASIAVLPLRNAGATEQLASFGDGLAEEILNPLARIDCLDVVPRTPAFQLGSELDPNAAGRQLEVGYALSGSWRGGDDLIRVDTRLVEVESGRLIWSDSYDLSGPWTMRDILRSRRASRRRRSTRCRSKLPGTAGGTRSCTGRPTSIRSRSTGDSPAAATWTSAPYPT